MKSSAIFTRFSQIGLAIVLIALVTSFLFVLRDVLDTTLVALLYLIPLGVIATLWGVTAGITSAFVTFLTFNYFFIQPYYTFSVHRPTDVVILIMFLVVAVVISQLVGRMQASLAAATAREREATQLYELSTALAGLHDEKEITKTLARYIQAVLHSELIEIQVVGEPGFVMRVPDGSVPEREPEWALPIEAVKGTIGEIRVWRQLPAITTREGRLLRTFASQGALALGRARLIQTESRAKILEESDRLKSVILSSVSHELRTPLSTIKAAASSLRSNEIGWESTARVDLIAAIDDEADHLNMLVGNLLDMSRIESGALKPRREWNILSEIVGSVVSRMKHQAKSYRIEMDIPESLPLIPVDYVQMEQVFTNLLSNSLKYAPEGSLIRMRAFVEADEIHIVVQNQGPQIPNEHLERIFDKFFRLTATDRVTGTGLGLSICKGIIEAHSGKLWAENVHDGLAFNFTLPLIWEGKFPPQMPVELEEE